MNAELIYKSVLERLAEQGNPEAQLALELGKKAGGADNFGTVKQDVCGALRRANVALGEALGYNDTKWTRNTDRAIEQARDEIAKAFTALTK
jgi:hypothetical protein